MRKELTTVLYVYDEDLDPVAAKKVDLLTISKYTLNAAALEAYKSVGVVIYQGKLGKTVLKGRHLKSF